MGDLPDAFRALQRSPATLQGAETVAKPTAPDANGTGPNSPSLLFETSPISWKRPVYSSDNTDKNADRRSVTVSVKLNSEEAKFLNETIAESGLERADFLRQQLLSATQEVSQAHTLYRLVAGELWANRAIHMGVLVQFLLGKSLTPELLRSITADADKRKHDHAKDSIEDLLKVLHAS
jgi:hypothetical protein